MNNLVNNRNAIEYNRSVQSKVSDICDPLRTIGVKAFTYYRVFEDGRYMLISDDQRPVEHCIQNCSENGNAFRDNIKQTQLNKYHFMIWPPAHDDDVIRYYANNLSLGNGLCVYKRLSDGSIDSWGFIADKNNSGIVNEYINHTSTFTKFIEYFNTKAKDLIDTSDPSRLAQYETPMDISEETVVTDESLFNHNMFKNRMNMDMGVARLTRCEKNILDLLSTGRTMKQISSAIGCSPRTVETHIRNVKKKTRLNYKSELIAFYNQTT